MATAGPPVLPDMPDFGQPASTSGSLKDHLQLLLQAKEQQLQSAGLLGQRLIQQQSDLEERIRQLQDLEADKGEDEPVDGDTQERYRELKDAMDRWEGENAELVGEFGPKVSLISRPSAAGSRIAVRRRYCWGRRQPQLTDSARLHFRRSPFISVPRTLPTASTPFHTASHVSPAYSRTLNTRSTVSHHQR